MDDEQCELDLKFNHKRKDFNILMLVSRNIKTKCKFYVRGYYVGTPLDNAQNNEEFLLVSLHS